MLVPLKWLRQFVKYDLADQDLADLLSLTGLEVDGIEPRNQGLDLVVAAKIIAVDDHPNADRLHLVTVEYGADETRTVVCGAPGVEPGQVVPLALEGAKLGDITVKKAKIRGVESRGMLCSERDLGLSDDHGGLMALPADAPLGQNLVDLFDLETAVMEISITPNRGDALSMLGVATEVGALLGLPVSLPDCQPVEDGKDAAEYIQVQIDDPESCPRYVAKVVEGIKIGPSPLWVRDRLQACGVRPINNIVDVTNFVMMELGQPLHAFDYGQVGGPKIIVRQAAEGEGFTTLDNKERKLEQGMLLICDTQRPVALAGVMGGLNSEIEEHSTAVLIEAAFFNPTSIRRTAKHLNMGSESSYRFERGINREGCLRAAGRAAKLMSEWAGGTVAKGAVDAYPLPYEAPRLELSVSRTAAFLGTELDMDSTVRPLEALGLKVEQIDDDRIAAWPPATRTDLERPVDLTEEVARLIGYDKFPFTMPSGSIMAKPRAREQVIRERVRDIMTGHGLDEAINYSFGHPEWNDKLRLAESDDRRKVVNLTNPLSEDLSQLRTSLLPGLLSCVRRNLGHRVQDVAMFEVGKVFIARGDNPQPFEPARLGAVISGLAQPVSWFSGEAEVSLSHIRGVVEYLMNGLGIKDYSFRQDGGPQPYMDHEQWLRVYSGDSLIGELGLVAKGVCADFDIKRPVYYLDLDQDLLVQLSPERASFRHLPRYPEVMRDVALVVDDSVAAGEVLETARQKGGRLLRSVELFDIYKGKPLPKGRKSVGLRLAYRADDRTLTEEEVVPDFDAMVEALLGEFQGELRG